MPTELKDTKISTNEPNTEESKRLMFLYGVTDWYEWRIKNWGTKWDCYDINGGEELIEFNTAWTTPIELIKYLSHKFPAITFTIKYASEDIGNNCGTYIIKNGIIIEEREPIDRERFACEILNHDYDEYIANNK